MDDLKAGAALLGAAFLTLAAACGGEKTLAQKADPAVPAAAEARVIEAASHSGAVVDFGGEHYELSTYAQCGADDTGEFDTWAVTMSEEDGTAVDGAPRVRVSGTSEESMLQFYKEGAEPEVQLLWMDGNGIAFEGNTLRYDGTVTGVGGGIQVTVTCP